MAKFIAWRETERSEELITSFIAGDDLADLVKKVPSETIISLLVQALKMIHQIDVSDCPFGQKSANKIFIHGDACLPNFIIQDGKIAGIIDLSDSRIDDEEVDVAAAVWTLNFNFGPGQGLNFLKSYGWHVISEVEANRLIEVYETQI